MDSSKNSNTVFLVYHEANEQVVGIYDSMTTAHGFIIQLIQKGMGDADEFSLFEVPMNSNYPLRPKYKTHW